MPAVKSLRQESNNSSKPEYIRGHHFGFVGLLVGSARKTFCCPLQGELHEGVDGISPPEGLGGNSPTLITRMAGLFAFPAPMLDVPTFLPAGLFGIPGFLPPFTAVP